MDDELKLSRSSTQDIDGPYRRIHAYSDGGVVLVGGRYALSGSRSNYDAVASFMESGASTAAWTFRRIKSHPFTKSAIAGVTLGACIETNFTREPCGVWMIDLASGELMSISEFGSLTDITADTQGLIAVVPDHEDERSTIHRLSPSPAVICQVNSSELNSLANVSDAGAGRLLLSYQVAKKRKVLFRHMLYATESQQTIWELLTSNDRVQIADDVAYTYSSGNRCEAIEKIKMSSGRIVDRIQVHECGIQRLGVMEDEVLVWANDKRQLVAFACDSRLSSRLDLSTTFPGWLDFCFLPDGSHGVAISTDNHLSLRTYLTFFSLER